jgi:DNA polymerase-3 subunit epsilon
VSAVTETERTPRKVVVVDTETTTLDPATGIVVEVAYRVLGTDVRGEFIPPHNVRAVLRQARRNAAVAAALEINGYRERIQHARQDVSGVAARELAALLGGNTLAGSNPAFDAKFLAPMFRWYGVHWPGRLLGLRSLLVDTPRWHHRLLDLSSYAAGVLGTPLGDLQGLEKVCAALGVTNERPHGAASDVAATVECLKRLRERSARV